MAKRTDSSKTPSSMVANVKQTMWPVQDLAPCGFTPTDRSTASSRKSSIDPISLPASESVCSTDSSDTTIDDDNSSCGTTKLDYKHSVLYDDYANTQQQNESKDEGYLSIPPRLERIPRLATPPRAKRIQRPLTVQNETIIDNYRWMHQIKQDPDVQAYIDAESNYTMSWIEYSGIENLQKQLEDEIQQIKNAMERQPMRTGRGGGKTESADGSDGDISDAKSHQVERLEGTQFWDLDRWRYWLDESKGEFGVYKRRPVPKDSYQQDGEGKKQKYVSSAAFGDTGFRNSRQLQQQLPPHKNEFKKTVGGCSSERGSAADVEVVLDVNQIAKKHSRKRGEGQFTFGTIEIQPQHTFLQHGVDNRDGGNGKPESEEMYVAYTFDNMGDERYRIGIVSFSSKDFAKRQTENKNPVTTDDQIPGMLWQSQLNRALESIKDAGSDTRFVKLGRSLYLYYTRLDRKGLQREVWRIKIDSLDDEYAESKDGRPKYEPELVMQEEDERNYMAISQTADQQFLLIESLGQTNSYCYFLSIDNYEKGWKLIRRREEGIMYKVEHHSGFFYLRTNHGGAANFKVLRVAVNDYLGDNSLVEQAAMDSEGMEQLTGSFLAHREDQVVIEHDPDEFIDRFEVFVEHFVTWVWCGGVQAIRVFLAPHPSDSDTRLPLPEAQRLRPYQEGSRVATVLPGNVRYEEQRLYRDFYSTKLQYSNCSFVNPWALYEYDMHSLNTAPASGVVGDNDDEETQKNATRLVCQDPFPLGIRYGVHPGNIKNRVSILEQRDSSGSRDTMNQQEDEIAKFKELRLMVPSRHGSQRNKSLEGASLEEEKDTLIPVSVVYHLFPDGPQFPRRGAVVNAYGAYGTLTSASFDPESVFPLIYRGLLYVQVHPRGDGVLGSDWHADGRLEHKINTFLDVEDVLWYLKDSGLVEKEGCVIQGRSAGGLVAGWLANRWGDVAMPLPDDRIGARSFDNVSNSYHNIVREMVKAVVTQVPFVDVIAGMVDTEVPWTEYEWDEWGNPMTSREVFEAMKMYSPYDRIRSQPYPAMMIMGGMADARVSYAEPLKFVAKLRSIDGKTNDCQPVNSDQWEGQENLIHDKDKDKMCEGKKETPLLLQMEDGGHFSGKSSLWMAFALYTLA
ncbi:hypothetical protein EDD11_005607 [Mortierella claussenii]|nr:hypothetical protein EDD11_005607 [Mortierella claussenii]